MVEYTPMDQGLGQQEMVPQTANHPLTGTDWQGPPAPLPALRETPNHDETGNLINLCRKTKSLFILQVSSKNEIRIKTKYQFKSFKPLKFGNNLPPVFLSNHTFT